MSSEYTDTTDRSTSFKVVIVGDRAVGKTSLAARYVKGVYSNVYAVTVGIEFYSKTIRSGDDSYQLNIWDTVRLFLLRLAKRASRRWSVPSTTRPVVS